MHKNELDLKELKKIQKQLSEIQAKTPDIIKKLKAVEVQIKRQTKEGSVGEDITQDDNIAKM